MTNLVKGLDAAFALFTPAEAAALHGEGFRVYFGDGWTGGLASQPGLAAVAEQDLRVFREAGFYVGEYINASPPDWWPQATGIYYMKLNAGTEWANVREVPLDWEIEGTTWERVFQLGDLVRAEGKVCDIIYTRKNIVDAAGPCPDVAKALTYRLWLADYDGVPSLGVPVPEPWASAGWHVIGKQYGGDTMDGKDYDANIFDMDRLGGNDMTADECKAVIDAALKPLADDLARAKKDIADLNQWFFSQSFFADDKDYGNNASAIHKRVK